MNLVKYPLAALVIISVGAGLFGQPSVKERFQGEYRQLVEDALHTSAEDSIFWDNARQIVFGERVPTTDTSKAKALFQSDLNRAAARTTEKQAIVVPAHSKVTYHGKPFCLQHDAAAPGVNAPMWLIPSAALFPTEARGIAKAVLRYSANHPADENVVQTIFWAIRHADKTPLTKLGADQERVLNASLADGAAKYYTFVGRLRKDSASSTTTSSNPVTTIVSSTDDGTSEGQPLRLERSKQGIVAKNLQSAGIVAHGNLNPYNPTDVHGILEQLRRATPNSEPIQHQAAAPSDGSTGIATDGFQSLAGEDNATPGAPRQPTITAPLQNPEDNAYTQLSETVGVRVHTNSLTDSTVEIANNSDTPYEFDATDYIGMAKPVSQPTYITPPAGGVNGGGILVDEITGQPIGDKTKKVIVLIHGWTQKDSGNAYTNEWLSLIEALKAKLADSEWKLVLYHWEQGATGANTGDVWNYTHTGLFADFFGYGSATVAAVHAQQQGTNLFTLLNTQAPGLRSVHFIAHSAGSWAAREAMRLLLTTNRDVRCQMTLLDPFVPDAGFVGEQTGLTTELMNATTELPGNSRIYLLENYWADDRIPDFSKSGPTISTPGKLFIWRAGDIPDLQVDWGVVLDPIVGVPIPGRSIWYDYHAGPIRFYADTVNSADGLLSSGGLENGKFDLEKIGWKRSLFYCEKTKTP